MTCNKCLGSGWQCEKHSDEPQGHSVLISMDGKRGPCPEAGAPCDCAAFPHKPKYHSKSEMKRIEALKSLSKKPREFWTSIHDNHLSHLPKDMDFPEDWIHVREVVEINDEEINAANKFLTWNLRDAFEAGARWMKAKMEGKNGSRD